MADFEEFADICMGHKAGEFISAYQKNQKLQTEMIVEGNPVAMTVVKLMDNRNEWSGLATQLLTELEAIAAELKINVAPKSCPVA
jgi:hypothetical protein